MERERGRMSMRSHGGQSEQNASSSFCGEPCAVKALRSSAERKVSLYPVCTRVCLRVRTRVYTYIRTYLRTYVEITNTSVFLSFCFATPTLPLTYTGTRAFVCACLHERTTVCRVCESFDTAVSAITNSRPHLEIDGRGKILSFQLVWKIQAGIRR